MFWTLRRLYTLKCEKCQSGQDSQQEKLFSFNLLNVVTEDLQYYHAVTSKY